MTKIIKAGVVGCGGIANGKHFPAIKKNGKIELVAFCDLIKERAEKAKEEYGTPDARVYTDYTELVKEDVDVVYVLTPNNAHFLIASFSRIYICHKSNYSSYLRQLYM